MAKKLKQNNPTNRHKRHHAHHKKRKTWCNKIFVSLRIFINKNFFGDSEHMFLAKEKITTLGGKTPHKITLHIIFCFLQKIILHPNKRLWHQSSVQFWFRLFPEFIWSHSDQFSLVYFKVVIHSFTTKILWNTLEGEKIQKEQDYCINMASTMLRIQGLLCSEGETGKGPNITKNTPTSQDNTE